MALDWEKIDRWIMGEAWVGSRVESHISTLCNKIGPRWASSPGEQKAIEYINGEMTASGLSHPRIEEFELKTWKHGPEEARVVEDNRRIDLLPFLYCPPVDTQGPIVDTGFGMPHELAVVADCLPGAVAVVSLVQEPFTDPRPLPDRLQDVQAAGAVAAVVVERKSGSRMEYHSATDWRRGQVFDHPVPTVVTSREDGSLLRLLAAEGKHLAIKVQSHIYSATGLNTLADLSGNLWSEASIVVGAHHDTVFGSPGGNDNASGVTVVLETACVLSLLQQACGFAPGCNIRFCTWSAEEQAFQGAEAYVRRHHGPEPLPRLVINLDELATGPIKGIALQFPHLRPLVQGILDEIGEGLRCHVLAHLDASSDGFPFTRRGIPSGILWRWRFVGRHPDADFHHEPGDTADKVRPRELREYVGLLARILLRLSHVPPAEWPANPLQEDDIAARIKSELGTVGRTM